MDNRTISDLKKLRIIKDRLMDLRLESLRIKDECPCLDYEARSLETLAFEITPKAICPVCEKVSKHELSLQEKIDCLKQSLDCGDDTTYTEEDYKVMAVEGGFNFPSIKSPCLKG